MCTNPFSSRERQHFPEFSPMFKPAPSSTERNNSFRWSIDNIARLKPAEINTDAANLVKTNGHSPNDDHEAQSAIDTFFSQKVILPSPWPVTRPKTRHKPLDVSLDNNARPSPHVKKVTFSPLPPATAFIRDDSLVESDLRDSGKVDAGTQTVLTLPMNFDLEKLLLAVPVQALSTSSGSLEERDVGNCSLRRKLFGQPERQGSSLSPSPTLDSENMQLSDGPFDPTETTSPAHFHSSPPLHMTEETDGGNKERHNPAFSSLILKSPLQDLPGLSPIVELTTASENEGVGVRQMQALSPIGDCHQTTAGALFPVTPKSKSGLLGAKRNRSLLSTAISPIGVLPSQPLTCRTTPMVEANKRGSACTSTPNNAVPKRQLIASPFASPVLKHPCTERTDIPSEPVSHDNKEEDCHDVTTSQPIKMDTSSHQDGDSSDEMAEPLSLDDLRSETLELTNITSTSCTDYFTNLDLDDNDQVAIETQGHTHNGTAGVASTTIWPPHHPKAHSTMVDSQLRNNQTDLSGPQIRGLSQIPVTSQSSMMGVDSGVAASVELNPSVNMSNSGKLNSERACEEMSSVGQDGIKEGECASGGESKNGGCVNFKTPTHRKLDTIREADRGEMVDSGLVFSPDVHVLPTTTQDGPSQEKVVSHKPSVYTHPAPLLINNKPLSHTLQSVLPSRLQVQAATPALIPPSPGHYKLKSPVAKFSNTPRGSSPVTKFSNTPRGSSPIGQLLHETPPSRYGGKFGLTALNVGQSCTPTSVIPEDVLKKKKALKARLQFSSTSGCPYHRDTIKDLTPHSVHSRVPSRALPHSRSPLTSINNNGYTPFSHTLLSPIRSSFLSSTSSTTPTSPWRSPWQQSSPLHRENLEPWRTHTTRGVS